MPLWPTEKRYVSVLLYPTRSTHWLAHSSSVRTRIFCFFVCKLSKLEPTFAIKSRRRFRVSLTHPRCIRALACPRVFFFFFANSQHQSPFSRSVRGGVFVCSRGGTRLRGIVAQNDQERQNKFPRRYEGKRQASMCVVRKNEWQNNKCRGVGWGVGIYEGGGHRCPFYFLFLRRKRNRPFFFFCRCGQIKLTVVA